MFETGGRKTKISRPDIEYYFILPFTILHFLANSIVRESSTMAYRKEEVLLEIETERFFFDLIFLVTAKLDLKEALYFVLKQDLLFPISHSRALSDNRVSQKMQNGKR